MDTHDVSSPSPDHPGFEALRYLHTRLKQLRQEYGMQVFLFANTQANNDLAPMMVALARIAASTGEKVLLFDGNLREPALHTLLTCPTAPGLAEVLDDPQDCHKVIQTTAIDHVDLLSAGAVTPENVSALSSPAFDHLMSYGKQTYNLLLCSAAPVRDFSDAAILGGKADACCLVLTSGSTPLQEAVIAKRALEALQANVVGIILTL